MVFLTTYSFKVHPFSFSILFCRCSDDPDTRVVMRTSHETRFVFQDFEYSVNHKSLYIFCEANFCRETDYSSVCNRACPDNRKRKGPPHIKRNDTDGTTMIEKNNTSGAGIEVHTATVSMQLNFVLRKLQLIDIYYYFYYFLLLLLFVYSSKYYFIT